MNPGRTNIKCVSLGLAIWVSLLWTGITSAVVVTIYTDKTLWENALNGQVLLEDFNDSQLNDGVSFVSSESGHINPALGYYQDVLTSESQNEPMTIWSFSPFITAYGGTWTLGGPGGSGNSLLVYIEDFALYVGYISNSYNNEFWGFICDTPFTSVKLVGAKGSNQQSYQLDNMVYAYYCHYALAGDFDGDCKADLEDFAIMAGAWLSSVGGPAWKPACDLAAPPDGEINLMDLGVLAGNWLLDCVADPAHPACIPN